MLDARGLRVSGADRRTVEALDRFADDLLYFRPGALAIFAVATANPGCTAAQAAAAGMACFSQSDATIRTSAMPFLLRARAPGRQASERELLLLDAISAWSEAHFECALESFAQLLARWPQDMVAAKMAEFVFQQSPDPRRQLALIGSLAPTARDSASYQALLGFAHVLAGNHAQALAHGEQALAADADNPWAHHVLAHAWSSLGNHEAVPQVLARFAPLWTGHMRSIRAHNFWHLAVAAIEQRDSARLARIYRQEINGFEPESVFEHTDAISLLWRAELAGLPAPGDWLDFVDIAAARAVEPVVPFLSAHYVYALARAGEGAIAQRAIERLVRMSAAFDGKRQRAWQAGLPLLRGALASAEGAAARAASEFASAIENNLMLVGGSDAQTELFRQSYVVALIDAGRGDEASVAIRSSLRHARVTPLSDYWLARASGRQRRNAWPRPSAGLPPGIPQPLRRKSG